MLFARHQYESAMGVHVSHHPESPLTSLPTHSSGWSQSTSFGCPASCIEFAPVIYFTYTYIFFIIVFNYIITTFCIDFVSGKTRLPWFNEYEIIKTHHLPVPNKSHQLKDSKLFILICYDMSQRSPCHLCAYKQL